MTKVTIVAAYNTQVELTKRFLDKMQETLKDTKLEVSFVLVHGYVGEEEDIRHPVVTHFIRIKNVGYCSTINAGLAAVSADSDFVFLVGNDSFPRETGWLDSLVEHAIKTGAKIVCPADHLPVDDRRHLITHQDDMYVTANMWPSIAWLIPMEVLQEIGPMDETLYGAGYYSDDDYCLRVKIRYGENQIIVVKNIILDHLTSQEGQKLGITSQMGDLHNIYRRKWNL
jgi:GT2 family glycosyltransferase